MDTIGIQNPNPFSSQSLETARDNAPFMVSIGQAKNTLLALGDPTRSYQIWHPFLPSSLPEHSFPHAQILKTNASIAAPPSHRHHARTNHEAATCSVCLDRGRAGPKFTHTDRGIQEKKKIMTDRGVQKEVMKGSQERVRGQRETCGEMCMVAVCLGMLGNPGVRRREEGQDVRGADDAAVDRRRETERMQRTASE
ncbi:uncharacterized protein K444DRAFT_626420 [Hyaloscypha bicolor E]|uniref:Uncharacterized protein n=1 Tax=Hyaloscypha bicolor E TaxID=1095630 RepID=A0A2J6TLQ0_9HELO|nr:uncharacterized protein K444DRAFT_626420 [Hyaloscypha bicolor E]PMD63939.1 hypothetical protein K444DRAFT_626420 [Hyaloscypha bicolor E]